MRSLAFAWVSVVTTILRLLPFPTRTGLIKIGSPGREAPVLLTCNFRLTVERVRRSLQGIDAYLLVANSRGVNVWCAATGGLFTNHDVISVLKTSGIEKLVDHRVVILPQLAATGIESAVIHRRTDWRVIWGPVYAKAIAGFLERGLEKTVEMRTVRFPWKERLEMTVAWAFPISLLALLLFPVWRAGVLPIIAFIWAAASLVFLGFPLYQRWLRRSGKHIGFIFFSFGERGLPIVMWILFMIGLSAYTILVGAFSWTPIFRWGLASLVVLLVLGIDVTGSTPVYKGGLQEDRRLRIAIDENLCQGVGVCDDVCPTHVFVIDPDRNLASLPRIEACVQCGACIVQCPYDALYFRGPLGDSVAPETVRRFKLNLLGQRRVARGARDA